MKGSIETVRTFWNENPCQSDLSNADERRQYFEEIRKKRYGNREWHVPRVARFDSFKGKTVVEIGCGIATDGLEFATNGADYIGVDLTPNAIEMARERFELFGVTGRFELANAEEGLPFEDDSVDHVYSFGVIHHSPNTEKIVDEIHRILKKDGTLTIMIYNKSSINYYIEIMFLRRIFRWLLVPKFMPGLLARITGFDKWKLEGHREALIEGSPMTKERWISINTDGPYCPLAKVYNYGEAETLFHKFVGVRQEVWEFNTEHWSFIGRMLPESVVKWLGRKWGWHRMVYGRKG